MGEHRKLVFKKACNKTCDKNNWPPAMNTWKRPPISAYCSLRVKSMYRPTPLPRHSCPSEFSGSVT